MNTKRKPVKKTTVAEGSINVFADLGLPNADQELMKARLTLQIHRIIKKRGSPRRKPRKSSGFRSPMFRLWCVTGPATFPSDV